MAPIAGADSLRQFLLLMATRRGAQVYLLDGPRESGKGDLATAFAMASFCPAAEVPCTQCRNCARVAEEIHPDVITPRSDKRVLGIDPIRDLWPAVYTHPYEGPRKVFILANADEMSPDAANALLKILEEPPSFASFLLLSERAWKVPATVRSRCQLLRLRRPNLADLTAMLQHEKSYTKEKAAQIARLSGGRPKQSVQLSYDQFLRERSVLLEELEAIVGGDRDRLFHTAEARSVSRRDLLAWLRLVSLLYRDMFVLAVGEQELLFNQDINDQLETLGKHYSSRELQQILQRVEAIPQGLSHNIDPTLLTENLLLDIAKA